MQTSPTAARPGMGRARGGLLFIYHEHVDVVAPSLWTPATSRVLPILLASPWCMAYPAQGAWGGNASRTPPRVDFQSSVTKNLELLAGEGWRFYVSAGVSKNRSRTVRLDSSACARGWTAAARYISGNDPPSFPRGQISLRVLLSVRRHRQSTFVTSSLAGFHMKEKDEF